jgi:hypothetical protein
MDTKIVLTPDDKQWKHFADTLARQIGDGCDDTLDNARRVLSTMEGVDVEETLAFFEAHGGFCDCEVLMNVAADRTDEKREETDHPKIVPEMAAALNQLRDRLNDVGHIIYHAEQKEMRASFALGRIDVLCSDAKSIIDSLLPDEIPF